MARNTIALGSKVVLMIPGDRQDEGNRPWTLMSVVGDNFVCQTCREVVCEVDMDKLGRVVSKSAVDRHVKSRCVTKETPK